MRAGTCAPLALTVCLLLACATGAGGAGTNRYWVGGSGTWDDTNTANWNPAYVPEYWDFVFLTQDTAGDIDIVFNTTRFNGSDEIRRTTMGNQGGGTTTLYLTSTNEIEHNLQWYIQAGSRVVHTNGNVDGGTIYIRETTRYDMSGGASFGSPSYVYVDGVFEHTGGSGQLVAERWLIGENATGAGETGVMSTVSAAMKASLAVGIGHALNSHGVFTQTGGVIEHRSLGRNETEYFNVGATNGTGSGLFLIKGGTVNRGIWNPCIIRVLLTGTIQGYGTLSPNGYLRVDGKVVADGEGTDRTLDATLAGYVTNVVDNTSDKGWYAVNHGKLALKALAVPAGDSAASWGEHGNDDTPDLVNSARIAFSGITGSGTLAGSLLAADHSAVAAGLTDPIGVWEFTASGFTMGTATLTFRYDDALAASLGVAEGSLKLWQDTGGGWQDITASVDTGAKRIAGNPVSSFSQFAIAAPQKPTGTVILLR